MVKLLVDYVNKNNLILEINKKNKNGKHPLLSATRTNNIEITKLLIEYANKNKIILKLNEKSWYECYPLLSATSVDRLCQWK